MLTLAGLRTSGSAACTSQAVLLSGKARLAVGIWACYIQTALTMQICFSEVVRRHVCFHRFFTALSISFLYVCEGFCFMDITTGLKAFN